MFLAAGWRRLTVTAVDGRERSPNGTETMMSGVSLAIRCEALFVSNIQSSEHPRPPQIRTAITETIRRFGAHGCAEIVAQEYGDHPETAVNRMRWAREAVAGAYPEPVRIHLVRRAPVSAGR
jgi:hypothetical protein